MNNVQAFSLSLSLSLSLCAAIPPSPWRHVEKGGGGRGGGPLAGRQIFFPARTWGTALLIHSSGALWRERKKILPNPTPPLLWQTFFISLSRNLCAVFCSWTITWDQSEFSFLLSTRGKSLSGWPVEIFPTRQKDFCPSRLATIARITG